MGLRLVGKLAFVAVRQEGLGSQIASLVGKMREKREYHNFVEPRH
jgi:hypothetical protein